MSKLIPFRRAVDRSPGEREHGVPDWPAEYLHRVRTRPGGQAFDDALLSGASDPGASEEETGADWLASDDSKIDTSFATAAFRPATSSGRGGHWRPIGMRRHTGG